MPDLMDKPGKFDPVSIKLGVMGSDDLPDGLAIFRGQVGQPPLRHRGI